MDVNKAMALLNSLSDDRRERVAACFVASKALLTMFHEAAKLQDEGKLPRDDADVVPRVITLAAALLLHESDETNQEMGVRVGR